MGQIDDLQRQQVNDPKTHFALQQQIDSQLLEVEQCVSGQQRLVSSTVAKIQRRQVLLREGTRDLESITSCTMQALEDLKKPVIHEMTTSASGEVYRSKEPILADGSPMLRQASLHA